MTSLPADVVGVVMTFSCHSTRDAAAMALVSSAWHDAFRYCADDMWAESNDVGAAAFATQNATPIVVN